MTMTNNELALISIYNTGDRLRTIEELEGACECLSTDEPDISEIADSALLKLQLMTDKEFDDLDLVPDYDIQQ